MSKKVVILFSIVVIVVIMAIFVSQKSATNVSNLPSPTLSSSPVNYVVGVQTKTVGCVFSNGLPDKACTPGAVMKDVTKDQVCSPGYARDARNVPGEEKRKVFEEYGTASHNPGEYEIDHLISLELGGSNDIANLWPEAAEPRPGFHEKDQVENYLHNQVCTGNITLQQAQQQISQNWLEVYKKISQL